MKEINDAVVKWMFGLLASIILALGGWVYNMSGTIARLENEVESHESQLSNIWRNYNVAQEKENAALQRLTRIEANLENCCY